MDNYSTICVEFEIFVRQIRSKYLASQIFFWEKVPVESLAFTVPQGLRRPTWCFVIHIKVNEEKQVSIKMNLHNHFSTIFPGKPVPGACIMKNLEECKWLQNPMRDQNLFWECSTAKVMVAQTEGNMGSQKGTGTTFAFFSLA